MFLVSSMGLGVGFTTPSTAQAVETLSAAERQQQAAVALKAVKVFIAKRRYRTASTVLSRIRADFPNDPEVLFQSAEVARVLGQNDKAIQYYRQILKQKPDTPRVQLELARTYFNAGQNTEARTEFRKALKMDLPIAAKRNARRFLARIKAKNPVSVSLPASFAPSDNLSRQTEAETVALNNYAFTLGDDARAREGFEFTFDPSVRVNIPTKGNFKPYFGQRLDLDLYSESDLNTYGVGYFAGTKFGLNRFAFDLKSDYLHKRDEKKGLVNVLSTSLNTFIPVHVNFSGAVSLNHARTDNLLNDAYDADTYSIGTTGQFRTRRVRFSLGITGSKSNARDNVASFKRIGYRASLGLTPEIPFAFNLSTSFQDTDFKAGREDELYSVSLSTTFKFIEPFGFNPVLTVGHNNRNSTSVLSTYDRTFGGLSFKRAF